MASIFEDLKALKGMLERGEISEREYEIVKRDLLSDGGEIEIEIEIETEPQAPADVQQRGRHTRP